MVPVGEHDGCGSQRVADGSDRIRVVEDPQLMAHPVVVIGVSDRLVVGRVEGGGYAGGHGEPPNG